jgi:hypothetical protein
MNMRQVRRVVIGLVVTAGLSGAGVATFAPSATAAPITCPGGQTVTKTSSGWDCVNGGGNDTGAGRHKGNGDKV